MIVFRFLIFMLLTTLASCSSIDVSQYVNNQPKLSLETFFNGKLIVHGMLKDRSGKVTRTFVANINAGWKNGKGTLDEDFVFNDGEKQKRIWTLTKQAENRYLGTAGDVIGGAEIKTSGNAVFLSYTLQIDYKGKPMEIVVDDRMYLISPGVLLNESTLYKWGFNVGSLTLVIRQVNF